MLYWLSAVGNGTWESFKNACKVMKLENPQRILRRFKLLGHIESSSNGKYWSVAPTALVRIKSQSEHPEFILCGQQNEELLNEFQSTLKSA
ncbi:MAG: hypothetical protein HC820_07470 [Hydrococcus sp. RM1_1_31]|nr:hypothetical protein [Hydrococcus sp. RM1_1_31]